MRRKYWSPVKRLCLDIAGEIPRNTSFEKGFPFQYAERPHNDSNDVKNNLNLIPDPLVKDDQAIVLNVRNKGLVVITGCGHYKHG